MRAPLLAVLAGMLAACGAAAPVAPVGAPKVTVVPSPAPPAPAAVAAPLRETADAPFRQAAPELGAAPPVTMPPVRMLRLHGGARVVFLERHWPATVSVRLVLPTPGGLRPEVASLLANTVWDGATVKEGADILRALDDAFAAHDGWADPGSLSESVVAPSSSAEAAVALLAKAVMHPGFPAEELDRIKGQKAAILEGRRSTPTIASRALSMALLGADRAPFDRLARAADLRGVTREEVVEAHAAAFDPGAATFVVVGDATPASVVTLLEHAFTGWRSRAHRAAAKPKAPALVTGGPRLVVIDEPGSTQAHVTLGAVGPARQSPDWAAAYVLRTILGDGPTSRLSRTLRDEKHVAANVSATLEGLPAASILALAADAPSESAAEAVRELDHQVRELGRADIGAAELDHHTRRLALSQASWLATTVEASSNLAALPRFGVPLENLTTLADRYRATTVADVRRLATAYLDPARTRIVIVGDLAALRAPLRALGMGPIEVRDDGGRVVRVEAP